MSNTGCHNYDSARGTWRADVRAATLAKTEERFQSELGRPPVEVSEIEDLVMGAAQFRRRGSRWIRMVETPPVGLDCIAALNEAENVAATLAEAEREMFVNDFDCTDYTWQDFGPMDSVHAAFFEVECDIHRQKVEAWRAHETAREMAACEMADLLMDDIPVYLALVDRLSRGVAPAVGTRIG